MKRSVDPRDALAAQLASDREFGIEELPVPAAPAPARAAPPPAEPAVRAKPGTFVPRVAALKVVREPAEKRALLAALDLEVERCTSCKLHRTRTRGVPGEGNADADLMFVGEGPGAEEDKSGRPFVGRAGELLTKIIEAMGFSRETVFIANIVKSRPPENRVPEPDEVRACMPYLDRQIEIIAPKVLCTLGLPATRALLQIHGGISAVRGRKFQYKGIAVVPTFHPAYLLRNPAEKEKVWKDVQVVARLVAELGGVVPRQDAFQRFDPV
jgi:DNA polymerase